MNLKLSYGTDRRPAIRTWRDGAGVARIGASAVIAATAGALPMVVTSFFKNAQLFFFAAALSQGGFVGLALKRAFERFDLRSKSIAKVMAISAGVLSVALFQSFIYFRDVHSFAAALDKHGTTAVWLDMIGVGHLNPYASLGGIARLQTGHGGIGGWIVLRVKAFPHLPTLLLVQCIIASYIARAISKSALQFPICPSCGGWLRRPKNLAVVPTSMGQRLASAIGSGEADQVAAVVHAASSANLGRSCAVARKHRCADCNSEWVDLAIKAGKTEKILLSPMAVSDQLVNALRAEAAIPVESGEVSPHPGNAADQPPASPA